jgi:hypothetical protein
MHAFTAHQEKDTMRTLSNIELTAVSGGCCYTPPPPPPCSCDCDTGHGHDKAKKGNNGFGNGADANTAAPGNSGKTGGGKEGSVGDSRGPR